MDFDPNVISFESLLEVFWRSHDPTAKNQERLYQKGVFYHSDRQKQLAQASLVRTQSTKTKPVTTTLERVQFEIAKESDQKYYLRNNALLWSDFLAHYPSTGQITDSPAAAKVNGYLTGNSDKKKFRAYAKKLGLGPANLTNLEKKVPDKAGHWQPKCSLP